MNDNIKILGAINARANVHEQEWNDYEMSWDFKNNPLICNRINTVSAAFKSWSKECNERFNQLKANEEELNRIFIDIYGLQDELTPEVEDKEYFIFSDGGITIDDAIRVLNHADDSGMVSESEFLTEFGLRHINQEWEELFSAMRTAALDPKRVKELLKL